MQAANIVNMASPRTSRVRRRCRDVRDEMYTSKRHAWISAPWRMLHISSAKDALPSVLPGQRSGESECQGPHA